MSAGHLICDRIESGNSCKVIKVRRAIGSRFAKVRKNKLAADSSRCRFGVKPSGIAVSRGIIVSRQCYFGVGI